MRAAPFATLPKYPCVLMLASLMLFPVATARGSGFNVDDFEVGEVGSCSVESWIAFAGNSDSMSSVAPSCVVDLGAPVELGTEIQRNRAKGEWATAGNVSGKITLLRMTHGIGVGLSGEADWDLITGASTGGNINVPVTFDLGHGVHLNVNGGWLYDATVKFNYATWGGGVEWTLNPMWTLVAEVYGQIGPQGEVSTVNQPRFQTGVRITPIHNLDITVIYGRNLNGENTNWLTLGFTLNFPAK